MRSGRSDRQAALAAAYLQKVRETGDASFYTRADRLLRSALARTPSDQGALVQAATLAAARHDFRAALKLARQAQAAEPSTLAPLPILVDALVELGRYGDAERTLQRLVDLKPNLAAYARVSYFRELYWRPPRGGRRDGARRRGRRAGSRERRLRAEPARRSRAGPRPARRGPARLRRRAGRDAGLRARRRRARAPGRRRRRPAPARSPAGAASSTRLPLPEYVIALGETELAAGRRAAARRDLELVHAQQALLAGAGVNTDVELALFEADHGDPQRGLALARAAWAARAQRAVRRRARLGADPRRAVRARACAGRTGRCDSARSTPALRYHAGMTALAAGRRSEGRRDLRLALAHGLDAQPLHAARAREALR